MTLFLCICAKIMFVCFVFSLASARLCRGEARLARRIDIENNHNSCATHTAGESGDAITLEHWRARHASPLQSRQRRELSHLRYCQNNPIYRERARHASPVILMTCIIRTACDFFMIRRKSAPLFDFL